jgi:hypothetical protein
MDDMKGKKTTFNVQTSHSLVLLLFLWTVGDDGCQNLVFHFDMILIECS